MTLFARTLTLTESYQNLGRTPAQSSEMSQVLAIFNLQLQEVKDLLVI